MVHRDNVWHFRGDFWGLYYAFNCPVEFTYLKVSGSFKDDYFE